MICPFCKQPAQWVSNEVIYGRRFGDSYMIYYCVKDNAYVGCHKNTHKALGTMANAELREWRIKAHAVIDPLWKSKKYQRHTVYIRLSEAFGKEIHIGETDIQTCQDIIKTVPLIFQK